MKPCCIAISIALLLAVSARAQEPDCGWWDRPTGKDWKTATVESVTACLKAGADPNARGQFEFTPLQSAAYSNANPAVIEVLLKAGADLESRNEEGSTPLHLATKWNGNPAVIEFLLKAGADLEARAENGSTPLHYASARAARSGRLAVIEFLLKAGADPNAKNTEGKTPWDLAKENEELKRAASAAYWKLNEARFRSPQGAAPPPPRPQARPAAKPAPSAGPCEIPGYPKPDNPRSLGLSWCPASVGFQVRVFALTAAGAKCALSHGSTTPDQIQARRREIAECCERLKALDSRLGVAGKCLCPEGY